MLVYQNSKGKVFYRGYTFLVKINHVIGLIECNDYDKALELLNQD